MSRNAIARPIASATLTARVTESVEVNTPCHRSPPYLTDGLIMTGMATGET